MSVGFPGSGGSEIIRPSDFNEVAFESGSNINLVGGCNTALNDPSSGINESLMEQFAKKVDSKSVIKGSDVYVYYPGVLVSDKGLVKKNNGKIVEMQGKKE